MTAWPQCRASLHCIPLSKWVSTQLNPFKTRVAWEGWEALKLHVLAVTHSRMTNEAMMFCCFHPKETSQLPCKWCGMFYSWNNNHFCSTLQLFAQHLTGVMWHKLLLRLKTIFQNFQYDSFTLLLFFFFPPTKYQHENPLLYVSIYVWQDDRGEGFAKAA